MKKFLKNKFKNFIFQCISSYNDLQYKKNFNIAIPLGTELLKPFKIGGGQHIFIGQNTLIGHGIWLEAFDSYLEQTFTPKIIIGNNVNIGNNACITAIKSISIGDNCLFSEYVYISDHAHGFDPESKIRPAMQELNSKGSVVIGHSCFLGFRSCILPGVILGDNCIVGANSVVTKSFPNYSMVAGVPAKLIKVYSFEKKQWIPA